ncbi:MAG: hypothetical protein LBG96_05225 [Tannerella sp.]|nr:hypothetical protein [Tannerella sp.]
MQTSAVFGADVRLLPVRTSASRNTDVRIRSMGASASKVGNVRIRKRETFRFSGQPFPAGNT